MARLKDIPAKTKKFIIQEAGGICGFCGQKDVSTLEFHHIHGKDIPDPHAPENLIYVCKNCHGKITAGQISEADVHLQKQILRYAGNPNVKDNGRKHIVNLHESINTGIIANVVHFHGKAKHKPTITPASTIGADAIKRNYLKHLIDRYHEFAIAEKKGSYKFPVFYQAIKRRYGAKWDMIPIHQFESVCLYVQERIDRTALGRNRKVTGQSNYSLFPEYYEKYVNK